MTLFNLIVDVIFSIATAVLIIYGVLAQAPLILAAGATFLIAGKLGDIERQVRNK